MSPGGSPAAWARAGRSPRPCISSRSHAEILCPFAGPLRSERDAGGLQYRLRIQRVRLGNRAWRGRADDEEWRVSPGGSPAAWARAGRSPRPCISSRSHAEILCPFAGPLRSERDAGGLQYRLRIQRVRLGNRAWRGRASGLDEAAGVGGTGADHRLAAVGAGTPQASMRPRVSVVQEQIIEWLRSALGRLRLR